MSSSLHDNEGETTQKTQEGHIPNIEEFLNSPNDNIFLNDSLVRCQKRTISTSEEETDEHKYHDFKNNDNDNNNTNENHTNSSDDNKELLKPQKRKKKIHIDPKFNEIISAPVDLFPSSNSKSYTMTNPDHRYRTFCEIVLVAHHPNYLRNISDFNFIKEIGKGGYGAVWLADDMRTGNQCAVKELYVEELKGRILTNFLREIHSMILCRGEFICPIIGYTIEPPYSIITKYMPGGDLYHAVHNLDKKNKTRVKPKVYGTHLTIICMCIAHALRHVHRCGIIHRDIKPGNILLDDDGLPYLVDFGVSRLIHPENRHSQYVGTVSHMAPEVISSTNYGTKADVFSYAILLYEVGEKRHAFHNAGKHSKEVCQQILNGERPSFSPDAIPTAMRNLITRCWSQNPADRPSFDKIFQIFCEGKTYFKGSSPRKIVKFAQKLIKKDESEMKIPLPPSTNMDVTAVLSRLMRKLTQVGPLDKTLVEQQNQEKKKAAGTIVEKMIQKPTILEKIMSSTDVNQLQLKSSESSDSNTNESNDNIKFKNSSQKIAFYGSSEPLPIFISKEKDKEIANDIKNPQFFNYIQFELTQINPSQFDEIAQFVIPALVSPSNFTKEILQILLKIAEKNNDFLIKYNQYHIMTSVMLTDENDPYADELFELLSLVFVKIPSLLGQMYTRVLAYFIKKRPKETICLFSNYVYNVESIMDPFPILDFLMSYARVYINIPSGALFIDLFFYLTSQFAEYKEQRFNSIKPILTAFSRSTEKIVAYEALKAICNLYDDSFKINIKTLINYIRLGSRKELISNVSSIPDLSKLSSSNLIMSSKSVSNLHYEKKSSFVLIEEKLRDVSLSLIERLPEYPLSNMFVQEIAFLIDSHPIKVINILLKYAHQSIECAQIVARRSDLWMDPSRSNNEHNVLNVFLEIFQYPELRNQLVEAPEFPLLMTSVIKTYDKSTLEAIVLIFKRVKLTGQIIDDLENAGFYNEFAEICNKYCKGDQSSQQENRKSSEFKLYNELNQSNSPLAESDDQILQNTILANNSDNNNSNVNDNNNNNSNNNNSNNNNSDNNNNNSNNNDNTNNMINNMNFENSSNPNLIDRKTKKSHFKQHRLKRNSTYGIDDNHKLNHVSNERTSMNFRTIPAAAMVIIETSSKVKYLPCYKLFIPMILIQLPLQNEMTAAAIHTLTVLSFHHELKPVLNKPVLLNYFSQLKQFKAQKKYAITFLFNLLKKA